MNLSVRAISTGATLLVAPVAAPLAVQDTPPREREDRYGPWASAKPSARHADIPPSKGLTFTIPRRFSRSAARALVNSLGQVQ
jgi:hypothetical protein